MGSGLGSRSRLWEDGGGHIGRVESRCVLAQWTHQRVRARGRSWRGWAGCFLLSTHQPRFYLLSFPLNVSSLGKEAGFI